jgi:hypothetical protein
MVTGLNGRVGLNVHWSVATELEFEEGLVPILEHNMAVKTARVIQLKYNIVMSILALVS